jgi:hypothetical protein
VILFSKFFLVPIFVFGLSPFFKSSDAEITVEPVVVTAVQDTIIPAEIQLVPAVIDLPETTEKFIVQEVKILNTGGEPLKIRSVTPSCGCAAATVLNGIVRPMTTGKIRLSMNTSGMSDTLNRVEFVIESNAKNSPTVYSAFVRLPKKPAVTE